MPYENLTSGLSFGKYLLTAYRMKRVEKTLSTTNKYIISEITDSVGYNDFHT